MRAALPASLAACSLEGERREILPGSPSFDCGTFDPRASLHCSAVEPEFLDIKGPTPLAAGGLIEKTHELECPFSHPSCPPISTTVRVAYSARCGVEASDGRLVVEANFQGAGRCIPGLDQQRSSAFVVPRWAADLSLPGPGGRHRVEVTATTTVGLLCRLSVGDVEADPILPGEAPVLLTFVDGPARLPVVLDCSKSLGGLSCQNTDPCKTAASEAEGQASMGLRIKVERCPDRCLFQPPSWRPWPACPLPSRCPT